MTQHPRPPLFGWPMSDRDKIEQGLGPDRVLSHAEKVDRITRDDVAQIRNAARETHWPPEKDREMRPKMRFFDHASFQHTMQGPPATVADITGPGIDP